MNDFANAEWRRASRTLKSAEKLEDSDPDSAASRAYYAAFHAVTALFALRGQVFSKHTAVRSALHRDLIQAHLWPRELGKSYDLLMDLRETGDYGGLDRVSSRDARDAAAKAAEILRAVEKMCPELSRADDATS
jgi:uncharacterized protein (UPF0332 family)